MQKIQLIDFSTYLANAVVFGRVISQYKKCKTLNK